MTTQPAATAAQREPETDAANTWPSIQPQQARTRDIADDWADQLALEIALDMQRLGTRYACELTAARLRLVKLQGQFEATNQAVNIIDFRHSSPRLQREYAADVEENGIDGWGV